MRASLLCLTVALCLFAASARAQEPVHQWKSLGEAADGAEYLEDTANVERAGTKRQVWIAMRQAGVDSAGVPHPMGFVTWYMFDCSTYQMKRRSFEWQDIDLSPSNIWLKAIKSVCPAEPK